MKEYQIIHIADLMYYNPLIKSGAIIREYCVKWQFSRRTMERIIRDAKQYNRLRLILINYIREKNIWVEFSYDTSIFFESRVFAKFAKKTRNVKKFRK